MSRSREKVVQLIKSWEGKNESDGSFKSIIDIYNTYKPQPRNTKMPYNASWCACTWSALAISLGYLDIMPIEISCGFLIAEAKRMGVWVESDSYIAKLGDAILYDWDDSGKNDNTGWPDHIGTIISVNNGYYTVMEGNYKNAVKKRTISINGKFIRGFITPKYDSDSVIIPIDRKPGKDSITIAKEVIAGDWGSGNDRKKNLEASGYSYSEIQKTVNLILNGNAATTTSLSQTKPVTKEVSATCTAKKFDITLGRKYRTTAALYCRNDAGTNMKALCKIPANTQVECFGYYNVSNGINWPLVQVTLDGIKYTGFCCIQYLAK